MTRTRSTPILTDNSLNVAFGIKYLIYTIFGISGVVVAVPSIAEVAGEIAAVITASVVAISAFVASVSAFCSNVSLWWQKVEYYSTIVLCSFILVYAGSLITLVILGSENRVNIAIIATALLVMPIWRLLFIYRNQKK